MAVFCLKKVQLGLKSLHFAKQKGASDYADIPFL